MRGIRTICTLLAFGIVCSFCACGKDADDKASETVNITSSVTSETESSVSSASSFPNTSDATDTSDIGDTESTVEKLPEYDVIIKDYASACPWFDGVDQVNVPHGGSDMFRYHSRLWEVGFAFVDINSDGQLELLLSGIKADCVYDMYTVENGEIIHVFSSGERSAFNLYENGFIELVWANSAGESGHDFFRLENGELKLIERVTYDAYYAKEIGLINGIIGDEDDNDCYFKSNTEDFKDYIHITADEAVQAIDGYQNNGLLNIKYTPLSEYVDDSAEAPHQNLTATQISATTLDFNIGDIVSIDEVGLKNVKVANIIASSDDGNSVYVYIFNDDRNINDPILHDSYLAVVYNGTVFFHDFETTCMGNLVYLNDMTGDGKPEIIIQQELDSFGGMGQYYSYVYSVSDDGLTTIFANLTRNYFDLGFNSENLPDKKVLVTNSIVDYSLIIDISDGYEDESFDEEGKHHGSMELDGCFYEFTPIDTDGDGVYEIEAWQYACYTYHNDGLGYAKCILKYDTETGSLKLIDAEFLPDEKYR